MEHANLPPRANCIFISTGWRIDYQIATPGLAAKAVKAHVERAASHGERWSDHAPVTAVYDV
jgi:exodeoxyribonuclease III